VKVSKLNGKSVITSDACNLGEVDGAHADIGEWRITHLGVELTKDSAEELGFKKPLLGSVTVCLPVSAVKQVGDVVTLNQSLSELKSIKECTSE